MDMIVMRGLTNALYGSDPIVPLSEITEIDVLKAEIKSLKAEIAKYKSREAFNDTLIHFVVADKDCLRNHMECEGWTKGKTPKQIDEMVESAYDYANDNIQSLIDADDTVNGLMDDWWEEAEQDFKPIEPMD
jgi:hypothetical protein